MITSRDELVKQLKRIMPCTCSPGYKYRNLADPECSWCGYGEDIVEFIIEDRKRICEPLVKYKSNYLPPKTRGYVWGTCKEYKVIEASLKLAGIEP